MSTYQHQIRRRYEDPEMEPGRMSSGVAPALVIAFALGLLAVPAWREASPASPGIVKTAGKLRVQRSPTENPAGRVFATAVEHSRDLLRAIQDFEAALEDGSPLRRAALPGMQWAQLRWGGIGNETVYAGREVSADGWLIFRPGYDHLVGRPFLDPDVLERRRRNVESWRPPIEPDPRPALRDFHRRLGERGIELLLLPVPTKPAIHPESLAAGRVGVTPSNPSLRPFLQEMEDAGIHVFDPAQLLVEVAAEGSGGSTGAYLRTDSHWTPRAVERVAAAVAERIGELVDLPTAERDWYAAELERRGRGDLWRLLELPPERPIYDEETVTVREITDPTGILWEPRRGAPVLLLGDSFANVYSEPGLHWGSGAGLAEQVAYELGRDVDRLAVQDGSSDRVRRDLANEPDRLRATRIVVYQFATRELSLGHWPLVSIR